MAQGAYENPQAYGVDFTQSNKILQEGVGQLSDAIVSMERQKNEAYKRMEENLATFKDETHIEPLIVLTEKQNEVIRDSVKNTISAREFSLMGASKKADVLNNVKDVKLMREAMATILDAAQNNVMDKRIKGNTFDFISDLSRGENLEVTPIEGGIGFEMIHTQADGTKEKYGVEKIAMLATMVRDVEPILAEVSGNIEKTAAKLQEKKQAYGKKGMEMPESAIDNMAKNLLQTMELEEAEIFYAEYVPDAEGNIGRELAPIEVTVNGETRKLSREERNAIRLERQEELKNWIKDELINSLNPVDMNIPLSEREEFYAKEARLRYQDELNAQNNDSGDKEEKISEISDEKLYNRLKSLGANIIEARSSKPDFSEITPEFVNKKEAPAITELTERYGDKFNFKPTGIMNEFVEVSTKNGDKSKEFEFNDSPKNNKMVAAQMKQWMKDNYTININDIERVDLVGNSLAMGGEPMEILSQDLGDDGELIIFVKSYSPSEGDTTQNITFDLNDPQSVDNLYDALMQGKAKARNMKEFTIGGKNPTQPTNLTPSSKATGL